jgi:hypothetical protein
LAFVAKIDHLLIILKIKQCCQIQKFKMATESKVADKKNFLLKIAKKNLFGNPFFLFFPTQNL